jgi:hypothetical protein
MWDAVLRAVDAAESWLVLLPLYAQITILLVVLVPLAWYLAAAIDPIVDRALRFWGRVGRADRRAEREEA